MDAGRGLRFSSEFSTRDSPRRTAQFHGRPYNLFAKLNRRLREIARSRGRCVTKKFRATSLKSVEKRERRTTFPRYGSYRNWTKRPSPDERGGKLSDARTTTDASRTPEANRESSGAFSCRRSRAISRRGSRETHGIKTQRRSDATSLEELQF